MEFDEEQTDMTRRRQGQSLLEAITGLAVIIPLGLFAVDLVAVMQSTQTNEQWAEIAARNAASKFNEQAARQAAEQSLEKVQTTAVISSITLESVVYDTTKSTVTIGTRMLVSMPVPLPYMNVVECHAKAVQPIVALPAAL